MTRHGHVAAAPRPVASCVGAPSRLPPCLSSRSSHRAFSAGIRAPPPPARKAGEGRRYTGTHHEGVREATGRAGAPKSRQALPARRGRTRLG